MAKRLSLAPDAFYWHMYATPKGIQLRHEVYADDVIPGHRGVFTLQMSDYSGMQAITFRIPKTGLTKRLLVKKAQLLFKKMERPTAHLHTIVFHTANRGELEFDT